MESIIDCLFIGHNEMKFKDYEKYVRMTGVHAGAYRDLNLNFFQYNGRMYTAPDAYNTFVYDSSNNIGPFSLGNVFSATIAYLGSYIDRQGFSFDYINSFQNQKEELAEKLKGQTIRAIAIPTTLYVMVYPLLEIIQFVKKYNTAAKIIIGGPFILNLFSMEDETAKQYLYKTLNADFYINSNQGEIALTQVLNALKNKRSLEKIKNITYRQGSKYITSTFEREENILEEHAVNWDIFSGQVGKFVNLRTSISCPFACMFCEYPQRAGKYQTVSVDAVEKELNMIEALRKVECVGFIDDTFNFPPGRFKDILRMIIKNKYSFKWYSFFRCQYADKEMVELMKESGCEGAILGIESGSQKILDNMNKSVTVDSYRRGLSMLNEYGIPSQASLIIGFPGETGETVSETLDFIEECKPTFFRPEIWYCSQLAPIIQQRKKYGIEGTAFEWSHNTMDARTACDIVENMFLSVKNSLWVPQYNFDFSGVMNLLHRGLSMEKIKDFIMLFNNGVGSKLTDADKIEVDIDIIEKLKALKDE